MEQTATIQTTPQSFREVKMGRTVYRVTSVFLGEKDLGKTLEQLIIRKAMTDIKAGGGISRGVDVRSRNSHLCGK